MKLTITILLIAMLNFLQTNSFADTNVSSGDDPRVTEVIPNSYAGVTGTGTFLGPLSNAQRTYQFLIQSSQLTNVAGKVLTGLSMRIPASATANWPLADANFTNYDIYLSGSVEPSARSLTFANNIVGARTQVRSGSLTILEIYKDMIKTKAYLEGNNFMAHYIYNSIAQNAISSGELKWAEKFINEFRSHVHSDFRDSSFGLCNSILQIKKENYDKALESLSIVKPQDIIFKLKINHTLLIIYFLQNETESFFSLTDSFRHFLSRNRELREHDKIVYSNFITYIRKLYKFRTMVKSTDENELYLLKCQIESDNKTVSKQWILEIINDMTNPTLT